MLKWAFVDAKEASVLIWAAGRPVVAGRGAESTDVTAIRIGAGRGDINPAGSRPRQAAISDKTHRTEDGRGLKRPRLPRLGT